MCRFLCYMGPEVLLADLLYRPKNSLILQSYKSRERKEPLNGDGFGVGWYTPQSSPTPCIFASITPAWNNQNLRRLSEHVKSACFFAHVRAASPGMRVCEMNCHPLVPGFPLDGGRVLRAIVWWLTGDAKRATMIAARTGQFIAFSMILLGVWRFFSGAGLGGLWIAFIGWFLLSASRESYAQVAITEGLRGVRVADVMSRDYPTVDARSNLQTLVDEHFLLTGRRSFFVTENGRVAGLVTPHEVREIERQRWPYTTVDQVMRPLDQLRVVAPDAPVSKALEMWGLRI